MVVMGGRMSAPRVVLHRNRRMSEALTALSTRPKHQSGARQQSPVTGKNHAGAKRARRPVHVLPPATYAAGISNVGNVIARVVGSDETRRQVVVEKAGSRGR